MAQRHKIFIAGAGGIGRALALMLLDERSFPCEVLLGDIALSQAESAARFADPNGATCAMEMPLTGTSPALDQALGWADAIVDCLPGAEAPRMARLARQHGCHYLNLTEYVAETEEVERIAAGADTCFALQCGLAPGAINVIGNHLASLAFEQWGVTSLERMRMRVGALPRSAHGPHFYGWTWSPVGVATEYVKPATVVRDHKVVERPSLSELEHLMVEGQLLEADLTSGGAADLPAAFAASVANLDYKTLRFPGHYAWVESLLAGIPEGAGRPAALQAQLEAIVPHCEDDQVVVYADVEGLDQHGARRVMRVARAVPGITVAGRHLRAIQSTTAAGVAETLRLVVAHGWKGVRHQSSLPTLEYLTGPFVVRGYGDLRPI
ncbi:MAG: saccharopine dehydrogenase NADP-binding domain-containing protein [Planctomycetota bacterium]